MIHPAHTAALVLAGGSLQFRVTLSLRAPQEGKDGQVVEVYGVVQTQAMGNVSDPDSAGDQQTLFVRSGCGDHVVLEGNEETRIGSALLQFSSFDEATSGIELFSSLSERDPERTHERWMGTEIRRPALRERAVRTDGTMFVRPLVGRHIVTHTSCSARVEVIYDIALVQ
ncbi:MAG: hypothetical protein KTR31_26970 [Myxococcales bacterium]|nr:hypothetical protein [Myxococcales bacterium]